MITATTRPIRALVAIAAICLIAVTCSEGTPVEPSNPQASRQVPRLSHFPLHRQCRHKCSSAPGTSPFVDRRPRRPLADLLDFIGGTVFTAGDNAYLRGHGAAVP